jgi:glycerophosphoryl diester phosphodiesterase
MPFFVGGHRGYGCTDHSFYSKFRNLNSIPAENTCASIKRAFEEGADFVEVDAVYSADRHIFVLHNVMPSDHFFVLAPEQELNKLKWSSFKSLPIGRAQNGALADLHSILTLIKKQDPHTAPFSVNIELKGVQGSRQPADQDWYFQSVRDAVVHAGFKQNRILFSSFSLASVIKMAALMPLAHYGMLFQEQASLRPIYSDHDHSFFHQYIPFNATNVRRVKYEFHNNVTNRARLKYLHPEISTITNAEIEALLACDWNFNVWALFERLTPQRRAKYARLIRTASSHKAAIGIITDYTPEIVRLEKS